jgi:pimeloyl-ACP methyl ester carboxylesterase
VNNLALAWMFAAAASQTQCRSVLPAGGMLTEFKNRDDRLSIWEYESRVFIGWDGTKGTGRDWGQNAWSLIPNREGFAAIPTIAVVWFLRDLADYLRGAQDKETDMLGHSQGGQHTGIAPYYLHRLHGIRITRATSFGGPPYALDETKTKPPVTRVVCGGDWVECKWMNNVKRAPNRVQLDGCPGGEKYTHLLDHDYGPYTWGMERYCERIGDADGAAAMQRLLDVCGHTWRKLEGI